MRGATLEEALTDLAKTCVAVDKLDEWALLVKEEEQLVREVRALRRSLIVILERAKLDQRSGS